MAAVKFKNNATATLSASINGVATSISLQTGQGALFDTLATPGEYFMATLFNVAGLKEIVKVTARSGDTFTTVVRAQEGTAALSWSAGDKISARLTAGTLDTLRDEIITAQATATGAQTTATAANTTANAADAAITAFIADIASTATGDGGTLVALEDIGGYFPTNNVEAALQYTAGTLVPARIQSGTTNYAITAGSINAYTLTLSPVPGALTDGMEIRTKFHIVNSGPSTININGFGAKHIVDIVGNRMVNGQLQNQPYLMIYNAAADTLVVQGAPMSMVRPGPRHVIQYKDSTTVYIREAGLIQMGGFRFQGRYTKQFAPSYPGPQQLNIASSLGAESSASQDNWYGVFAVSNNGDTNFVLKLMPFTRVGSVAGSIVTFTEGGEAVHSAVAKSYAWTTTNNLINTECLVISETVDGRPGNFSGRVTTISANTPTTMTLASIGGVAALDFLLPAPPGYANFCYLGSFMYDASGGGVEIRNIADSGSLVKGKMVNNQDPDWTTSGSIPSYINLDFRGYVSPLATAVCLVDKVTLLTATAGFYSAFFATDSSDHYVHTHTIDKEYTTGATTHYDSGIVVPFAFGQFVCFKNAGSLVASRDNNNIEISGWIEP